MRTSVTAVFLGILSFAGSLAAQPTVGGLLNNYSYIRPGLPNYGIAQGSIFDIFGTTLAAATVSQGVPLALTLGGTSISVTVNGTTTTPIPYFVSAGQISAILPSATPVGTGTITVTADGQTSAPAPITVVESAFGMLTLAGTGSGAAAAYDYSNGNTLMTQANAANPGEYLVLWGTGLGPVTGNEQQYQSAANLPHVSVQIGGIDASVSYAGRSAYPGLDQINVQVPTGLSGCSVSVVVTANGVPSNYATISLAASGRTCSDPDVSPITPSQYETLLNQGTINLGLLILGKETNTSPSVSVGGATIGGTTTEDIAGAFFEQYTPTQFIASGFGSSSVSIGSCVVTTITINIGSATVSGLQTTTPLNAGPQVTLNGPDGALVLMPVDGFYSESFTTGSLPAIIPSTGGTFTFNNGSGGPDVGAFTATVNQSITNPLVWTNMASITSVNRASGVQVTWTGGIQGSFVEIIGGSELLTSTDTSNIVSTSFACTAPVSAGQFTVPAAVLESLPASTSIDGISEGGSLGIYDYYSQEFTAPGLDLGLLLFSVSSLAEVPYN
jgi:uncharacterized protein (TIGR03437 family)